MNKKRFLAILLCLTLFVPGAAFADNGTGEEEKNGKAAETEIVLEGEKEMEWTCGIPFQDPGYTAHGAEGENLTDAVRISGEVICWKVGDYELDYELLKEKEIIASASRIVHVIPAELPETVQPERTIYLTFDDGPCENTELVLEILAKYYCRTFTLSGDAPPYCGRRPHARHSLLQPSH